VSALPPREVSSTASAPNNNEKIARIFPSEITIYKNQAHQFAPAVTPMTLGFPSAAAGIEKLRMFVSKMPKSASPRRTSSVRIRSSPRTGTADGLARYCTIRAYFLKAKTSTTAIAMTSKPTKSRIGTKFDFGAVTWTDGSSGICGICGDGICGMPGT